MERKINLEEILFTEVDKMREDFPDINLYSNEEMKNSPEWKYYMNAMKEACRQVLELAAENATMTEKTVLKDYSEAPYIRRELIIVVEKRSITDTINQVK